MIITKAQHHSLTQLMSNIEQFNSTSGKIENMLLLTNPLMKNVLLVKYDKLTNMSGETKFEQNIIEINEYGKMDFIEMNFKSIYDRYAFLGDCRPVLLSELEVK